MSRFDLVSIIVSALNEAPSLWELHERIHKTLAGNQPFELIVIDDGSTDNTLEELRAMRERYPNICVLSHHSKHGKSLSLMQGFAVARGDVAVVMDADLQDLPELIPQFLEKIDEGYDLVNGWRKDRRDSLPKVLVSLTYNLLTRRIFGCPIHDINCGFKAMRRCVLEELNLRGDLHRLIPAIAVNKGFKVTEIPVAHAPRRFGGSRYRLLRHRGLLDIITLVAGSATQLRPFHIASEAALCCWGLAMIALAGWIGLTVGLSADSLTYRLATPLIGLIGIGAGLLGMILPLFGFQLDITTRWFQDARWRKGLLKENLEAEVRDRKSLDVESTVPPREAGTRDSSCVESPTILDDRRRGDSRIDPSVRPVENAQTLGVGCGKGDDSP